VVHDEIAPARANRAADVKVVVEEAVARRVGAIVARLWREPPRGLTRLRKNDDPVHGSNTGWVSRSLEHRKRPVVPTPVIDAN